MQWDEDDASPAEKLSFDKGETAIVGNEIIVGNR